MNIPTISTLNEIPEPLHIAVQAFLATHPDWDADRFMSTAIVVFLASLERK